MPRSVRECLNHMLDETEYLMESSRGIGKERFLERSYTAEGLCAEY